MTVIDTDPEPIVPGDETNTVIWVILSLFALASASALLKAKK